MLTQEQIQNLKPGDKLALSHPLIFREYDSENDELHARNNGEYIYFHAVDVELPSEHGTSVPTPKHDPTRLFKKGDRVRVVEWNGRKDCRNGMEATVLSNERGCFVDIECMIKEVKAELTYPACHLELVTPAEELGPYSVRHNEVHAAWSIYGPYNLSAVNYFYGERYPYTEESANAAAEAERDRLNAEWRKEHANE